MFDELVLNNRSCRGFDGAYQVSREELIKMIQCARVTASTMNVQPLKFYLGTEEQQVKEVLGGVKFAGALTDRTLPETGKHPTAFIAVCQDTAIHASKDIFKIDVGIVSQTILLKATEMGLGGCMMSTFQADKVKGQLHLPENIVPMLMISIGKPVEKIVLVDAEKDGSTKYYRDKEDTHYVPKRKLEDIIL